MSATLLELHTIHDKSLQNGLVHGKVTHDTNEAASFLSNFTQIQTHQFLECHLAAEARQ